MIITFSPLFFKEIAAIPVPVKLDDSRSSCNRNHETLALAQKLGHLQNHTSAASYLPGLLCSACETCVAVYIPEDIPHCHSTNSKSHFKKITDVLRSDDCQKVSKRAQKNLARN